MMLSGYIAIMILCKIAFNIYKTIIHQIIWKKDHFIGYSFYAEAATPIKYLMI